ncbi:MULTISPECIES: TfoX/Sxy family protein [unclassified Lysobacter]|uniref:TfoX/Sxy family protein n=1 Tax=unclassified Lysobacter TaxID=2635362 RepID=UPI001C244ED3|nr:TfoX/Sxy family protein [Lysobacter sp. MMG2]MBU8975232.1 TfoX/Sxy family protein [Lysobacter sp. MMG2]
MSDAYLAHLHDLLDPLGAVTTRAMFGGHGVYLDGALIGVVMGEALYLKVDDETRLLFEAAGCEPYVYLGQAEPITMSYWSLPDAAMDSAEAMRPWAELARAAASRASRKPKRDR